MDVDLTALDQTDADGRFTDALTEPVQADSYRWQAAEKDGWKDIHDLTEPVGDSVELPWNLLWDFEKQDWTGTDLRCVYSMDGQYYCTVSLLGEEYEPIAEPEPMPEGLNAEAEPGYSPVEADEEYGLYEFDLTFAEGETVKYIRVTALDDEISELPELGLFTISGCEGGELGGVCNTLTLMVSDNDKIGPSTLGFTEEAVTVDRSALQAKVAVRREGDTSYNVTIHYETVDGTAKAGVDYAKAEGELAFAGSIDEIEIPVELIANDAVEDRSFDVILTTLHGDGTDGCCTLSVDCVTVTLTGVAPDTEEVGKNLASLLAENDGEEAAGSVTVADTPLLADNKETLQGSTYMEQGPETMAEMSLKRDTRSHQMSTVYTFTRPSNNSDYSDYWWDYEALLGEAVYAGHDIADTAQQFKNTKITYGPVLSGDDDSIKDDVNKNKSITTSAGSRSGYTAQLTDANFSGNVYFERDPSTIPYATGYYFKDFTFDVEWQQVGFQQTSSGTWRHRYLLPTIILDVGGTEYSTEFDIDGNRTDKYPNRQTIRCHTDWSGGIYKYNSNVNSSGNGWSNDDGLTTDSNCYGFISIPFGKEVKINVDLTHKLAWIKDGTDSQKGLMTRNSHVDIRRFQGHRRRFTDSEIGLTLYTANDLDEAGNAIPLSADSAVYTNLAPTVSLTKGKSGVSTNGQLYVGSTLTVSTKAYRGFRVADNGVFMTNSSGAVVGTVTKVNSTDYQITMMWDGFSTAALNDSYKIIAPPINS